VTLRDRKLTGDLEADVTALLGCYRDLPAALAALKAQGVFNLRAATYDSDVVSGSGHSDPVLTHLLSNEQALQLWDHIRTAINDVTTARYRLAALLYDRQHGQPLPLVTAHHQAVTPRDILSQEAAAAALLEAELTRDNEEHCRSCVRTWQIEPRPGTPGVPRKLPVHRRHTINGDTWPLCSWCYRWSLDVERLPTIDEVEAHHAGRKIKRPAA
jgi:hypothetical protein